MTDSITASLFPQWRGFVPVAEAIAEAWDGWQQAHPTGWRAGYPALQQAFVAQDPYRGYTHVGAAVRALATEITTGERAAWLCGFLLWNMTQFEERFVVSGLNLVFRGHFGDCYWRILDQISDNPAFADLNDDAFMKDLALTRLTMIPAVAQLLYPFAGLSLKPVLRGGVGSLAYVYGRCGGRKPFLEIHTHNPMVKDYFNPTGWEETYRLTALALPAFPQVRGMMGVSWFYDPQLEEVSPRLGYLRHEPLAKGARLIAFPEDAGATQSAIATSPSRRALYEAGTYRPAPHALVWSRRDLLAAFAA